MEQPDDNILREFVAESREHLDAIEPDLLAMEELGTGVSPEVINRVFRAIHSIKGGAGFFAFERLKELSHGMESVLMGVRDGTLAVSGTVMDALLKALDRLRTLLDDLGASDRIPIAHECSLLQDLLAARDAPAPGCGAAPPGPQLPCPFDLAAPAAQAALARGMRLYQVLASPGPDLPPPERTVQELARAAAAVGTVLETFQAPGPEPDPPVVLLFATVLEPELAALALKLPESRLTAVARAPEEPGPLPLEAAGAPGAPARETSVETLRVRLDLLTHLMNLAGELVLGRNQLLRAVAGQRGQGIPGLAGILQNLDQVTTDLRQGIMQTRMQPIGTLFHRFPRLVRDLSRRLSKQIEVEIQGAEVELDKVIVEFLADPLTHLVRNCADHALETPAERRAAGKDPVGRIRLRAYHQGGQVCIEIRDDGRGIEPGKVLRKALERGLVDEARARDLTEREIVNLVFAPGFSTAEAVTEISGRGVGMDVVRANVEQLGGHVELDTRVGEGTTAHLRLPLTLAIIPSMIVRVGAMRLAIPQVNVVEFVWVKAADVARRVDWVHGAQVLRLRDQLLPLLRLSEVLGCQRTFLDRASGGPAEDRRQKVADRRSAREAPERRRDWRSAYSIVVVRVGPNPFGLIVDELFDLEEIVVKPLSAFLKGCRCFSGATILGDGGVVMILDVNGVAAQAQLRFTGLQADERRLREEQLAQAALTASRRRSVLLFTAGAGERFAVAQEQVLRLERVPVGSIERMGQKEYLNYRGEAMRLIRLDLQLEVRPLPEDLTEVFLLIPRLGGDAPAGILITSILDALDVEVELKPVPIRGEGILGSALVHGQLTLFLDPAAVVRASVASTYDAASSPSNCSRTSLA